jgi:hypothetical protein
MRSRGAMAVVLALFAAGLVLAAETPDFEEVALTEGGLSLGFGLLRLGGDAVPPESPGLTGHVVGRKNIAVRFVVDEPTGAAIGYRLEAASLSLSPLAIRVDIRPLAAGDEKDLKRLTVCASCPAPKLVGEGPARFPPTQFIRDGDTMVIDLLVRPGTGEKIVDVLTFRSETVTREVMDEVRGRLGRASKHVRQGDDLLARGSVEPAAAEYVKALGLQPDAATHLRLAQCYERLDRRELAGKQYEKAVRLNGADADAWHGLGVLQHRAGSYAKAVSSYEHAVKLRPEWALAHRNLATAHLDRAELPEAFAEYVVARRLSPAMLETKEASAVKAHDAGLERFVLAKVCVVAGDLNASIDWLTRAKDAGFTDFDRLREDPAFKPLLGDPRVVGLLARNSRS